MILLPINLFDAVFLYLLQSMPHSQSQTVVVENPMSVDESGKLVSVMFDFLLFFFHFLKPSLFSLSSLSSCEHKLAFGICQVSNVVVGVTIDKK